MSRCVCIKEDISLNRKDITFIFQNTKHFITSLNDITELFSYFLFWILVISVIGLIFATYRSIAFILGNYLMTWEYVFMTISFFIYFINYSMLIWYLCSFSQYLTSKVQDLKISILDLNFSREQHSISQNMNETEFMIERQSIFLRLDQFNGFHAEDFFIVNNSFITGMIANFITYVILLIQFKFNEKSPE